MQVLVLATNAYDFADKSDASRRVVGNSITYTTGQTLAAENGSYVEQVIVKENTDQIMRAVYEIPGVYEIEQTVTSNRSGKAVIKILSARLIKAVDPARLFLTSSILPKKSLR